MCITGISLYSILCPCIEMLKGRAFGVWMLNYGDLACCSKLFVVAWRLLGICFIQLGLTFLFLHRAGSINHI